MASVPRISGVSESGQTLATTCAVVRCMHTGKAKTSEVKVFKPRGGFMFMILRWDLKFILFNKLATSKLQNERDAPLSNKALKTLPRMLTLVYTKILFGLSKILVRSQFSSSDYWSSGSKWYHSSKESAPIKGSLDFKLVTLGSKMGSATLQGSITLIGSTTSKASTASTAESIIMTSSAESKELGRFLSSSKVVKSVAASIIVDNLGDSSGIRVTALIGASLDNPPNYFPAYYIGDNSFEIPPLNHSQCNKLDGKGWTVLTVISGVTQLTTTTAENSSGSCRSRHHMPIWTGATKEKFGVCINSNQRIYIESICRTRTLISSSGV